VAEPESPSFGKWDDLRPELPKIVKRLNADPALTIAAAANPLHALAELGYRIEPALQEEIEDRLRFRPDEAKQIARLRREVAKLAKRPVDPSDDEDVDRLLFEELRLKRPSRAGKARPTKDAGEEAPDRLEALIGGHDVVEALVKYRKLDAREPRFATPDAYRAIREGKTKVPVTGIRVVLKRPRDT
jgi:hypothetical protein